MNYPGRLTAVSEGAICLLYFGVIDAGVGAVAELMRLNKAASLLIPDNSMAPLWFPRVFGHILNYLNRNL